GLAARLLELVEERLLLGGRARRALDAIDQAAGDAFGAAAASVGEARAHAVAPVAAAGPIALSRGVVVAALIAPLSLRRRVGRCRLLCVGDTGQHRAERERGQDHGLLHGSPPWVAGGAANCRKAERQERRCRPICLRSLAWLCGSRAARVVTRYERL